MNNCKHEWIKVKKGIRWGKKFEYLYVTICKRCGIEKDEAGECLEKQ